jgi:enoyl-CoA hydratase
MELPMTAPKRLRAIKDSRSTWSRRHKEQRISADEAYRWGFAQELTEHGKAFDAAMAMAEKIARQPPISVAMTKMTVDRLAYAFEDLASHMDVDQFAIASKTEDHLEGVAAFLERRKPTFRGR